MYLTILRRILLTYSFLLSCFMIVAQEEKEYNVDSTLYSYFQHCQENIGNESVLRMADSLYEMSGDKKDLRMQAVALTVKLDHYYFNGENEDSIIHYTNIVKISGITSKNGRNDAKRLNIRVVTVSNDDKPKNRKTQRKADLRRRMVCKSLPVKE